ncbi:hydrogenase maturation protease [Candidatus Bathyarchaeota archaeon]|nr:hydrogenase maturation protease [Candidatus Bathyarchaeota archaeon]
MPQTKCNVDKQLSKWLRGAGRVVVVGVGNPIRMDDFVGVKIVQNLRGKVDARNVMLIDAETVPEDHLQLILEFKPTHVLIVDAAKMGMEAGKSRLIDPSQTSDKPPYSTHMLPLRVFCEYLAKEAHAKVALLLIEPELTDFGEGLTPEVETAAKNIARSLIRLLSARGRRRSYRHF